MADPNVAIDATLRQEAPSGVITKTAGDSGGRTRYAIAERWHSELTATGFFTTMSAAAALTVAEGVYTASYRRSMPTVSPRRCYPSRLSRDRSRRSSFSSRPMALR
jgi:hypothetical protein